MLILLESKNFFFSLFSNKHGFLNINTWKVLEQKRFRILRIPYHTCLLDFLLQSRIPEVLGSIPGRDTSLGTTLVSFFNHKI